MPRLTKRAPSYRKHASGQAIVQIDGRIFYLGTWGTPASRAEYERLIAEWRQTGRKLPPAPGQAISVAELLVAFLRHAKVHYVRDGKQTGEYRAFVIALRPVKRLYAEHAVDVFGPLALKTVRDELIAAGYARRSINIQVGRIRRVFKWGVENELVEPSVLQRLQAVAGLRGGHPGVKESKRVLPVPDADVDAVLADVPTPVAAMIRLQLLTGMRPGEVVQMRMRDIARDGDVWTFRPARHKTAYRGHDRAIHIGPKAQDVLRPFLRPNADAFLFSPRDAVRERIKRDAKARTTPRYPSHMKRNATKRKRQPKRKPRDYYEMTSYARAIARACKRLDIAHWHPHQLRHNAATRMRKEFGLDATRAVLGHTTPIVTEIYAELDNEKAREIMRETG